MLTRERLVEWMRARYGWRHIERRVSDLGYAYSIDTQPDEYLDGDQSAMTYGNGPLIVIKSSGAVWSFGSNPMFLPIYQARSEDEFVRALSALPAGAPHEYVPLG
ncbi:hypothetical protein [Spirillospora sp. CA-294931]|uniref:hypothetical protein n=1 Tax=Spirillospora sp. CA-294931 TaxID=3240042 RepID=UPI003D910886